MFPLSPMMYVYAAVAALVIGLGGAVYIQTSRLDTVKAEYAQFKAETKVIGEQAKIAAEKIDKTNKQNKETADASNQKLRTANATLTSQLRNNRASSSYVPSPSPSSSSPDTASFNRTELERTIQQLDAEIQGIIEEGDKARIDLDTAKDWAKGVVNGP